MPRGFLDDWSRFQVQFPQCAHRPPRVSVGLDTLRQLLHRLVVLSFQAGDSLVLFSDLSLQCCDLLLQTLQLFIR